MNDEDIIEFCSELMHYGKIREHDSFNVPKKYTTIRIIEYKSALYYTKQVNGVFTYVKLLKYPV